MLVCSLAAVDQSLRIDRAEEECFLKSVTFTDSGLPSLADSLNADEGVSHAGFSEDHFCELRSVEDCSESWLCGFAEEGGVNCKRRRSNWVSGICKLCLRVE